MLVLKSTQGVGILRSDREMQNSHECAPGKWRRMNTEFESVVELGDPSAQGKFREVNARGCAAIEVRKVCGGGFGFVWAGVGSEFARMRTRQMEADRHQI
jgi:hypothetical protein